MIKRYAPDSKAFFPELGRICFSNTEFMSSKHTIWENGLQFRQHVAKNKAKFGQISTIMRRFIEHLFFAFLEQFDRLLALSHKVVDEYTKVFVAM